MNAQPFHVTSPCIVIDSDKRYPLFSAKNCTGASSGRDIAQPGARFGGPKKDNGCDKGGPKTSKPVPTVAIPEAPASWKR
jgi:hypothetical protein